MHKLITRSNFSRGTVVFNIYSPLHIHYLKSQSLDMTLTMHNKSSTVVKECTTMSYCLLFGQLHSTQHVNVFTMPGTNHLKIGLLRAVWNSEC